MSNSSKSLSPEAKKRSQYGQQNNADPTKAIKVLFPSSIASFGREHVPPTLINNIPNEYFQLPTTIYGMSKVSIERLGKYYHRQGWVDFRAVRFPSVIGAGRGPGGTTIYSSLLIQQPAIGRPYTTYVDEGTAIAIIYVKDAVKALRMLHDAPNDQLGSSGDGTPGQHTFRRVFNLGYQNGQ